MEKDMKRLVFNYTYEFVDKIISLLDELNNSYSIAVYGKYGVVKDVLRELIMNGFDITDGIELEDFEVSHYDKEFVLYLTEYGVSVEKMYRDNKYLGSEERISFVHEDCNSKLLSHIESDKIYEFAIEDTNEDDTNYVSCDISNDDQYGFSVAGTTDDGTYYFSFYSTDKDLVKEVAEQFK